MSAPSNKINPHNTLSMGKVHLWFGILAFALLGQAESGFGMKGSTNADNTKNEKDAMFDKKWSFNEGEEGFEERKEDVLDPILKVTLQMKKAKRIEKDAEKRVCAAETKYDVISNNLAFEKDFKCALRRIKEDILKDHVDILHYHCAMAGAPSISEITNRCKETKAELQKANGEVQTEQSRWEEAIEKRKNLEEEYLKQGGTVLSLLYGTEIEDPDIQLKTAKEEIQRIKHYQTKLEHSLKDTEDKIESANIELQNTNEKMRKKQTMWLSKTILFNHIKDLLQK